MNDTAGPKKRKRKRYEPPIPFERLDKIIDTSLWCDDGIEAATRAVQDREIALTKQLIERYRREEAQLYWEGYADWKGRCSSRTGAETEETVAKHDWATIRKEYVEGIEQDGKITWPTLQALDATHGVDGVVLRMRAAKEKWGDLRDNFRTKQLHARQTARVKTVAHAGAKFDADILKLAQSLATMLGKRLETLPPEDTEGIRKVSAALVNVQRAGRIALGEPADGPLPSSDARGGVIVIRVIRDGPYGNTLDAVAETEQKPDKNHTLSALNSWPRDTQEPR